MRKISRIFAVLVALMLCAALLPGAALAADSPSQSSGSQTKHTVTFFAGGEVFATVLVPDGDHLGNMPKVPEIEGYTGRWDKTVDLVTCSVPVTAIYTPITPGQSDPANAELLWIALPILLLSTAVVILTLKHKEH